MFVHRRAITGVKEEDVLQALPSHLRLETLIWLEGDAITRVPFFRQVYSTAGLIANLRPTVR